MALRRSFCSRFLLASTILVFWLPASACLGAIFQDRTAQYFPTVVLGGDSKFAWGDYNNDGWVDIFANSVSRGGTVFRNNGGSSFTDTGFSNTDNSIWGDYNNDGHLDLFGHRYKTLLQNNGDGSFVSATSKLPASFPMAETRGAVWADFDNDAYLDLYVGGYNGSGYEPDVILRNEAGSQFTTAWTQSGGLHPARGITAADFDRDGDQDVYVSNYGQEANLLWRNDNSSFSFTNVSHTLGVAGDNPPVAPSLNPYGHTIGSAWGDFDNDGFLDLFVGNFNHHDGRWSDEAKFLRNPGGLGAFQLMAELGGADWQESYASPTLGDYDNDGDLDLYFTTVYEGDNARLYRNDGNWNFTDVTGIAGLGGMGPSYGGAWADVDNDGDLDLATASRLFINDSQSNGNHWLKIHLEGDGTTVNRSAIGAQVRVYSGGQIMTRQVEGGTGEGNQNDLTLHFGLGSHSGPVDVEIFWPEGTIETISDVQTDQLFEWALATNTFTWDGQGDGNWATAARWLVDGSASADKPGTLDNIVVQNLLGSPGTTVVTVDSAEVARALTINSGRVSVHTGGSLAVGFDVTVGGGTLAVDGAMSVGRRAEVQAGGALDLAGSLSAELLTVAGANTVTPGATLSVTGALDIDSDLNMTGATLATSGAAITIGSGQTLTYDQPMELGDLTVNGTLALSAADPADRTITVNGGTMRVGDPTQLTNMPSKITLSGAGVVLAAAVGTTEAAYDTALQIDGGGVLTAGTGGASPAFKGQGSNLAGITSDLEVHYQFASAATEADLGYNSISGVNDGLGGTGTLAQVTGPGILIPYAADFGTAADTRHIDVIGKSSPGEGDYTFAAWVKNDDSWADRGSMIHGRTGNGDEVLLELASVFDPTFPHPQVEGNIADAFVEDIGSGWVAVNDLSTDLADGLWHHLASTWDGDSNILRLYVDGVLVDRDSRGGMESLDISDFQVGLRNDGTQALTGSLADVRMYNRLLSDGGASVGQIAGGDLALLADAGEPIGPLTLTLGSPGRGVTLNSGTLTVETTDDCSLQIAGEVTGGGTMAVRGDVTLLAASSTFGGLKIDGGALNATGALTVDEVEVLSGTLTMADQLNVSSMTVFPISTVSAADHPVVVSDSLTIGGAVLAYTAGASPTFEAQGSNLADKVDLITLSGGRLAFNEFGDGDITSNLEVHYTFENADNEADLGYNSATSAYDGLDGAGMLTQVTGPSALIPYAANFGDDTETRHIDVAGKSSPGEDSYTFSAWVKTNNPLAGRGSIVHGSGTDEVLMELAAIWNGEKANAFIRDAGSPNIDIDISDPAATNLADNEWHHMASTWDGGSNILSLYLDGELIARNGHGGVGSLDVFSFQVGLRNDGAHALDGSLADVRMYNRLLSDGGTSVGSAAGGDIGLLFASPAAPDVALDTNLLVTATSTVAFNTAVDAVFGDLRVADGVNLLMEGAPALSVQDLTLGDGASLGDEPGDSGFSVLVRGTLNVGSSPGTATVVGTLEMDPSATYRVEIAEDRNDKILIRDSASTTASALLNNSTLEVVGLKPMLDAPSPGGATVWGDKQLTIMEMEITGDGIDGTFATIPTSYGLYGAIPAEAETNFPAETATTYLGAGIWFGNETDDPAGENGVYYASRKVEIGVFQAAPGDTDGNRKVEGQDILNILQAGLFGDGVTTEANWGNGDFNADSKISGEDILALLGTGLFGDGTYPDSAAAAAGADVKLVVTGDRLVIDAGGATVTGFVLSSESGILTGDDAENLGLFQEDTDATISGAFAMSLGGEHSLGDVLGETDVDLTGDLSLAYTLAGQPGVFTAAVVVPEPGTLLLLTSALLGLVLLRRRNRA